MATTHTHGIWLNEAHDPVLVPLSETPAEKVPIRGYTTSKTGTKKQMERFLKRLKRNPSLIKKHIKTPY